MEAAAAVAIAAVFSTWGGLTQAPTSSVTWDAAQYYLVSSQLASGQVATAEAPYVYRLGLPWLAAQFWPSDPTRGFWVINVACGLAIAAALSLWLRFGVERLAVRLALVTLFAAAWHAPVRYVHFNSGYVDPPFLLLVLVGLLMLQTMPATARALQVAAFAALIAAGAFVRETMLMLPASAMLLGNPIQSPLVVGETLKRVRWFLLVPIAAGMAVIAFTHAVVVADTTRSFVAAALQWIRKPPTSYLLAWYTAYGPVLALLAFDWRHAVADLRERQHLAGFLLLCAVLAYFGGSDTERFVFWAMPIVYLLIGRSFERHRQLFRNVMLGTGLIAVQAISARIFWTIPDPRLDAVPLGVNASLGARLYSVADRVLVIDNFHWNLWSSFGSQPFKLVRLSIYVAVTAVLVWGLHRQSRRGAAR
jgi:hypothetical protein